MINTISNTAYLEKLESPRWQKKRLEIFKHFAGLNKKIEVVNA